MSEQPQILVIDDEKAHADAAAEALRRVGYGVDVEYTSRGAMDALAKSGYDVVITDLKLDGNSGLDVLKKAKKRRPATQVILLTGYGTVETAVEAMQEGALTYLTKGASINLAELRATVAKAVDRSREAGGAAKTGKAGTGEGSPAAPEAGRQPRAELVGMDAIIGNSASMKRIARLVRSVAPTTATVLIMGESGTGKELVAHAIHENSPRKGKPFVTLNCAALSEGILESELFGHEKGSFTGALASRKGRFEYADGGTLFLDEVADMPASTQVKLLRVLEYGEVFRVGSNEPLRVDVRLVAATNKELEREVEEGRFREDLYFRLKVVTLYLPALRERGDDITILTDAFVEEFSRAHGKRITEVTPKVRELLGRYPWPGNVRELRNCVESMIVVSEDSVLDINDLPDYVLRRTELALVAPQPQPAEAGLPVTGAMTLRDMEKELIRGTLEKTGGNREEAARILGIGERTLYRKINDYGLR